MEEIKLVPKKEHLLDKLKKLFENKEKRYLYVFLFILPFVIAIGIFGVVTYKEAKNLLSLVSGNTDVNPEYRIESMNYAVRDNGTDVQKEYFAQLKQAIEVNNAPDEEIAGLICKNFVADHYTWSNKQGQYDVGGMHYIFDIEESKNSTYLLARDGFYKYLSTYIKQYGANNLLEVESVEVASSKKLNDEYVTIINTHGYTEELGHFYFDKDYHFPEAWQVTCNWTYKPNTKFDPSGYATSMNFIVVLNGYNGRYEIAEASEKQIELEKYEIDVEESEEETDE